MKNYKTESSSFVMYKNWEDFFTELSDKQAGMLIKALFAFARDEEVQPFTGGLKMAFLMMSRQLDRDGEKWMETCARRAEAGKKGGRPRKESDAEDDSESKKSKRFFEKAKKADNENENKNETVYESENENENDTVRTEAQTQARAHTQEGSFQSPTVNEVAAYCAERKNGIDAQHFVDYFDANGWMLGKVPMQDWQAAVRRWERNGIRSVQKQPVPPQYDISHSSINMEEVAALFGLPK